MKTIGATSYANVKLADLNRFFTLEMTIPVQRKWLEKFINIKTVEKPELELDISAETDKVNQDRVEFEVITYENEKENVK